MSKKLFSFFLLVLGCLAQADAPPQSLPIPEFFVNPYEKASQLEMSPHLLSVDFIKTASVFRILIKAAGPLECYKQREIERIFEKDTLKIILKLKNPSDNEKCVSKNLEYEEKIYESPADQIPESIWVLGYQGWHKFYSSSKTREI
jgi:hypothetical protein